MLRSGRRSQQTLHCFNQIKLKYCHTSLLGKVETRCPRIRLRIIIDQNTNLYYDLRDPKICLFGKSSKVFAITTITLTDKIMYKKGEQEMVARDGQGYLRLSETSRKTRKTTIITVLNSISIQSVVTRLTITLQLTVLYTTCFHCCI